jgi:hypothetical protein
MQKQGEEFTEFKRHFAPTEDEDSLLAPEEQIVIKDDE